MTSERCQAICIFPMQLMRTIMPGRIQRPRCTSIQVVTSAVKQRMSQAQSLLPTAARARLRQPQPERISASLVLLYSGSLTTGSTTFSRDYKGYVIIGVPASSYSRVAMYIPKAIITTSAVAYQFADEAYYYSFNLSYSGSTVTLAYKGRSSSGAIVAIYGVN